MGGPDTRGPRTKSTVEPRTAGQSGGCGVRVGALRAPRSGVRARYGSGEGLEGAKAHSKAERLPVKVEDTNSLSRYCAPFLSQVASFLPECSSFSPVPVGPCRVCRAVPCRAVPCRAVSYSASAVPSFLPSFLYSFIPSFFPSCCTRRDAMRVDSRNRINENSRWTLSREAACMG